MLTSLYLSSKVDISNHVLQVKKEVHRGSVTGQGHTSIVGLM